MDSHKIFSAALLSSLAFNGPLAVAQEQQNSPAPETRPQVSPDVKEVNWIGFQQLGDGSRVFVRTNEAVNYRVNQTSETELVINVFNSYLVTETFKYPMDTSYFDSPVLAIRTETLEDITPSVQVIITLRATVPYEVKQENNLVFIDFRR